MKGLFSINRVALRAVAAAPVIGMTTVSPAHAETEEAATWRQRVAISVALAPRQPASYVVRGELYATDDELLPGTTVQLLIDGATRNHDYWDSGRVEGITYSYARDVAARGFPTFALDLVGSGDSSHLLSDRLTIQAAAYVAHQVVQKLRDGSITGVQFGKVITVGYSSESVVVWQEVISYADVDGLIVTEVTQSLSSLFQEPARTDLYPAINDPKFTGSHRYGGYLATSAGARAPIQVPVLTLLGSLAMNYELQVVDTVAWSSAFVGQYRFGERRDLADLDGRENSPPRNDDLLWNCGTVSTEPE
jgi:pimeloyl-ACP methyl ester carboxylesterase